MTPSGPRNEDFGPTPERLGEAPEGSLSESLEPAEFVAAVEAVQTEMPTEAQIDAIEPRP